MKKRNSPKERNPFIQHLVSKRSGPHQKTNKALRLKEKNKLKKDFIRGREN